MEGKSLQEVYDSILGSDGPKLVADEPSTPSPDKPVSKGSGKRDEAYGEPGYDTPADEQEPDPREPLTEDEPEEPDEADTEEEPPADKQADDDYEDIPERLVQAGRRHHMSDDDIEWLAENKPYILEEMAARLDEASRAFSKLGRMEEAPPAPPPAAKKDEKLVPIKVSLNEDDLDPDIVNVVRALEASQNKAIEKLNSLMDQMQEQGSTVASVAEARRRDAIRFIDETFDKASEEVPILGKVGSLTEANKAARIEAYEIAKALQAAHPDKYDDAAALQRGVNAVKGALTEDKLKDRLRAAVNGQRKKFIARPRHRKQNERSAPPGPDKAMQVIEQKLKEFGLDA